jgi:hypothetical protein
MRDLTLIKLKSYITFLYVKKVIAIYNLFIKGEAFNCNINLHIEMDITFKSEINSKTFIPFINYLTLLKVIIYICFITTKLISIKSKNNNQ